jgi:hypothetical protein
VSLSLTIQKLKGNATKLLRFIFEDKEMRGDRFDDLTCSKSGALSVDIKDIQASESYKKARMQSDRVLGKKSKKENNSANISNAKIDSVGRISLPDTVRNKIVGGCEIEFAELPKGRILILLTPHTLITQRDPTDN